MSIPIWIIGICVIAFLFYLVVELTVGLNSLVNLLTGKKEETESENTPLPFPECVGLEAEVYEQLTPYGKIKIKDHIYDAMSISGEISDGIVTVYKQGKNRLLVTQKHNS